MPPPAQGLLLEVEVQGSRLTMKFRQQGLDRRAAGATPTLGKVLNVCSHRSKGPVPSSQVVHPG